MSLRVFLAMRCAGTYGLLDVAELLKAFPKSLVSGMPREAPGRMYVSRCPSQSFKETAHPMKSLAIPKVRRWQNGWPI